MLKKRHLVKTLFLIGTDAVSLAAALSLTLAIRYFNDPDFTSILKYHILPFAIIFVIWILAFGAAGLYDLRIAKNNRNFRYRLWQAMLANTLIAVLILYLIPWGIEPRRNLFLILIFSAIFIFSWRALFNLLILKTPSSRVVLVGVNKEVEELIAYLQKNPQLGQRPIALIGNNDRGICGTLPCFPLDQNLAAVVRQTGADTVVITQDLKENKGFINSLFQIIPTGIWVIEFTNFYEALTGKIPLSLLGKLWFLENLIGAKKGFWEFSERTLDIILGLGLGLIALILYPGIYLAIKINSKGPVLFKQKRVGKNGKIFDLLKFRSTYRIAVGENEGWEKEEKDPYTLVGRFLRKTYLDELPQTINVLKGEMSFIGPRPERLEFMEELKKQIPFYEMRLLVKPGLTGWAQINMQNDASAKDAPEKMQYDLYYIKNRSLALDLSITLKTVAIMLQRGGK